MPIDFNRVPYYDDFSEDNMYYRLLFRPGRAVQARELTQIQTLLQNQIERLGRHVFKDGALVFGGKISYDRKATKYLAIKSQSVNGREVDMSVITPGMVIKKVSETSSGTSSIEGRITNAFESDGADPKTLLFKWYPNEPDNPATEGFLPGELLQICDPITGSPVLNVTALELGGDNKVMHYGGSAVIGVDPGIYFWNGTFVKSNGGSIVLSKYTNIVSYRIGYTVVEDIIQNDVASLEPSSESPNYSAPGADRYEIKLELLKYGNGISIDEKILPNFIEIARIDSGNLLNTSDGLGRNLYSVLGDELAKRTYEESGNYVSSPYRIKLSNKTTTDNPKLVAKMSEGVSYVRGYRHSLNYQNTVDVDKGRDALEEELSIGNYYGDNFIRVYDAANTSITDHPENANGLFAIGSGAGESTYGSSDDYGQRGAAVSLHCVPQKLVIDHSLTDEWKWQSTLVGTARPFQMVYDTKATEISNGLGRDGHVYSLWMGDFKSSPIANTVSVTNIIEKVTGTANANYTTFTFPIDATHGITANDRISVTGASDSSFNIDYVPVHSGNNTALVISGGVTTAGTKTSADALTLYRTTGNNSPYNTVVLDQYTSAAWNGSYIGSTISVDNSPPVKIVDYIGTDSSAETAYNLRYGFSKRGMIVLEKPLEKIPRTGSTYTLNMSMKQARSVVYNQNISATGADQYPAVLDQAWNIDPISGVLGGNRELLNDDLYGQRIDGDTTFNVGGKGVEDALLFTTGRTATKSLITHGNLDSGRTSNTEVFYTEVSIKTATAAATLDFAPAFTSGKYAFFERPVPYPYVTDFDSSTAYKGAERIKENFILVNKTTGQVETNNITKIVVDVSNHNIEVTKSPNFVNTNKYALLFPVRAKFAEPAYKKLIKANTTQTSLSSFTNLTDFENGHVFFAKGDYSAANAGARFDLKKPDGFKLQKVVHQVDNSSAAQIKIDIANTQLDITDRFDFDTGQRDMFYDNASIVLKPDVVSPNGNMLVIFDRFQRMDKPKSDDSRAEELDSPSYFSVDSYQYTTDLLLDHPTDSNKFVSGMRVTSNSGVTGYVLDYANTTAGTVAKVRLQDVTAPPGATSTQFVVDETLSGFNPTDKSTISSRITKVIESDLKYSEIPVYKSRGKVAYPLRNMIDFRPYVTSNNRVSDTIANSMMMPIPTRVSIKTGRFDGSTVSPLDRQMSTNITMDHFAGRVDKLVVTKDGNYTIVKGSPAVNPVPPKDDSSDESLTLFTLNVPPYTFDPKNVEIKENTVRRHTMKDIGRLAKRVENLEYYVSLNSLERSASGMDVTIEGATRFKSGIVADNFSGHSFIDTSETKASLGSGVLRPQQVSSTTGSYHFHPRQAHSGITYHVRSHADDVTNHLSKHGGVMMLDHTTKPMIVQSAATTTESVNPFDRQNFTGELRLTPDKDTWMDITKVPEYNYFVNGVLDNIAGVDENSTSTQITNAIQSMDKFWEDISGASPSLGDDITGTAYYNSDETLQTETVARNISLGSVDAEYFNTADIDAAISTHGITDGVTKNLKILPYLRSRDILVHGIGLKPNHMNNIMFDGVGLERYFARANKVYLEYRSFDDELQPETDGRYEQIVLTHGGRKANATLVAVRELDIESPYKYSTDKKYMVGYIVPEFDSDTGKVDYTGHLDGYYNTSDWSETQISQDGFQGSTSGGSIKGTTSGTTVDLWVDGARFNGHYTGTARFTDAASSNTTHLVLSPDAHRYVAGNFRSTSKTKTSGYPLECRIQIVAGTGAGQECIANNLVGVEGSNDVLELVQTKDGKTGITTGLDATSVYTIGMKTVQPSSKSERWSSLDGSDAITQVGDITSRSNHYGEKIGILHLPSGDNRVEFTNGRKLVEILDRYSKEEWLVSSYASAYYYAEGMESEEIYASPTRLEMLKEVRSAASGYRINDHPEDIGYIPAVNNEDGTQGKLAAVVGIEIANGVWTAEQTDGIEFVRGSAFGVIDPARQDHLKETLSGIYQSIKENNPTLYEQIYASAVESEIIDDDFE